jgi:hypothetical protein
MIGRGLPITLVFNCHVRFLQVSVLLLLLLLKPKRGALFVG